MNFPEEPNPASPRCRLGAKTPGSTTRQKAACSLARGSAAHP